MLSKAILVIFAKFTILVFIIFNIISHTQILFFIDSKIFNKIAFWMFKIQKYFFVFSHNDKEKLEKMHDYYLGKFNNNLIFKELVIKDLKKV